MTHMHTIETLTKHYAEAHDRLGERGQELEAKIEQLKREALPEIRQAVRKASEARSRLHSAIKATPELFEKPRTQVVAGIRIGFMKQRGKVEIDDEAAVIARIRKLLPEDQAELLVSVKETVDKKAAYNLTDDDLKRLGIRITDDEDAVLIKPTDSEIDKLVNALLKSDEELEQESAA